MILKQIANLKFNNEFLILIIITLIGGFFRFWNLGNNPPGIFSDELIPFSKTLSLLTHNGPLFSYSLYDINNIIGICLLGEPESILALGGTSFSIRAPGAFYGTLLIPVSYLLSKKMFGKPIGIISSVLIALNPWAIQASRVFYMSQGFDSLFFTTLGVYLFLSSFTYTFLWKRAIMASILLALTSSYVFTSYGRLTSILLFFIIFIYSLFKYKQSTPFLKNTTKLFTPLLFYSLIFITFIWLTQGASVGSTANTLYYFSPDTNLILSPSIHNLSSFMIRFVKYYSPNFLFLHGDPNISQNFGMVGEMLYSSFPFFYIGLFSLGYKLVKREIKFESLLLLLWLFTAPIETAAFVYNNYTDSSGASYMVVPLVILTSYGIYLTLVFFKKLLSKRRTEDHKKGRSDLIYQNMHRERAISVVFFTLLAVGVVISSATFSFNYYSLEDKKIADNPNSQLGEFYGYSKLVNYIVDTNITSNKIFIVPDGLFNNNTSLFNYMYYNLKIPMSYLYYLSDGRINNFGGILAMNHLNANLSGLVLTGSTYVLTELNKEGLRAGILYSVYRPNGELALALLNINGNTLK